jgi:transcription antitermination protein NusB
VSTGPASKGPPRRAHGQRSRGRELALKDLFAADVKGAGSVEDFDAFALQQEERGVTVAFARDLVTGVLAARADIDRMLGGLAANWSLGRMAVVDRNVLRIGAHEILHRTETPVRVAINEAVELAKKFGASESGAFVNGILDRVKRPDTTAPRVGPTGA